METDGLAGSQLMIAHPLMEDIAGVYEGDGDGRVRLPGQEHGGHQPGITCAQHDDVDSWTHSAPRVYGFVL